MPGVASRSNELGYFLGHSDREIRRLMLQAAVLRPITERLLRDAGIRRGMRVLDLGCGPGDVALLAAELVGRTGSVVGIDRSPEALGIAWERARAEGCRNVVFEETSIESYSDPMPFDLVIGRYILIHQPDPAAVICRAAGLARPGGIVAFHELSAQGMMVQSFPDVSLWQRAWEWLRLALQAAVPSPDAGSRLIEHFDRAGLPRPTLFCESPAGGGRESPLYALTAEALKSFAPQIVRMGFLDDAGTPLKSFEGRLRDAVVESRSQIVGPAQFCAWARA